MQTQDSNLKVRGTLNSYKPSQFVFLRWVDVGKKFGLSTLETFGCKEDYIFLEIVFGGVASMF